MRFPLAALILASTLGPGAHAWMGPGSDGDDSGASFAVRLVQTGVPSAAPGGTGVPAEVPAQPNTNPSGPGTVPGVPGAPRIPEVPVSPGTMPGATMPTTTQPALLPTTTLPGAH